MKEFMRNQCYTPHAISKREFQFSPATYALDLASSNSLIRFDESVKHKAHGDALCSLLIVLEAVATVRAEGVNPNIMQVMLFENLEYWNKFHPKEQKAYMYAQFPESSKDTIEASYEAYKCLKTIDFIRKTVNSTSDITVDDIYRLNFESLRGTKREAQSMIRNFDMSQQFIQGADICYQPTTHDMIDDLMLDLIEFLKRTDISPNIKSIIAHFQLEAISPVTEGSDRLGRLLAFMIWKKYGLVEAVFPPFSITPAIQVKKHSYLLQPYLSEKQYNTAVANELLEEWVLHSLRATNRSVQLAQYIDRQLGKLIAEWNSRVNIAQKDNTIYSIIKVLPGHPLITNNFASSLTGKKFKAVSVALKQLEELGILKAINNKRRNKVYIVPEVFEKVIDLEEKIMPNNLSSREFYKDL